MKLVLVHVCVVVFVVTDVLLHHGVDEGFQIKNRIGAG
jgi:hypothetical protein